MSSSKKKSCCSIQTLLCAIVPGWGWLQQCSATWHWTWEWAVDRFLAILPRPLSSVTIQSLDLWLIGSINNDNNASMADQWMDYAVRCNHLFLVRLRPALKTPTFCTVDQQSPSLTARHGGGSTNPPTNTTLPAGLTPSAPIWLAASGSIWLR